MRSGPELPTTRATRSRGAALGTAIGTLLGVEFLVLCIYVTTNLLVGLFSLAKIMLTGVLMVIGDTVCDMPVLLMVVLTERMSPWRRWVLIGAAVCVDTTAQSAWDTWARTVTGMRNPALVSFFQQSLRSMPVNFYANMMWVGLIGMQAAYLSLRLRSDELVSARASERATHLAALRFQLNPHFLFNALNAVSSLVVTGRAVQAEAMIVRLSDFLRSTLGARPDEMVRLEDEFDMLGSYLDVESVRFGDRLETRIVLPAGLRDLPIPPFLLQPLVENAMKYAVTPAERMVTVEVLAERVDTELRIVIRDDGTAGTVTDGGMGIGLANLRERLRLTYGDAARLTAGPANTGFEAAVSIPFALLTQAKLRETR
jgi:hypothetical protein